MSYHQETFEWITYPHELVKLLVSRSGYSIPGGALSGLGSWRSSPQGTRYWTEVAREMSFRGRLPDHAREYLTGAFWYFVDRGKISQEDVDYTGLIRFELPIQPQGANEMLNYSAAVFLINDRVRAIGVVYDKPREGYETKVYTFKTLDPTIKNGDYVVVPSSTSTDQLGMRVCLVVEADQVVDVQDNTRQLKWIISRFDKAKYDQILLDEDEAIKTIKSAEHRKKQDELRDSLLKSQEASIQKLAIAHQKKGA